MMRLNKYLAHAGAGSRRRCDEIIQKGRVKVNDQVVRDFAFRVGEEDRVTVDNQPLHTERIVYWLVNKPRGYLCTNKDPQGRPRAVDLVDHVPQRVYTVGRLDEDSEGLLLLTNDGDLAYRLMHPRFGIEKTYLVLVAGKPSPDDIKRLLTGVWLSDGHVKAKRVKRLRAQGDSTWLEITLNEGKNREIRRMLAKLDHKVMRLRRLSIGPLHLGRLRPGKSRPISQEELAILRKIASPSFKGDSSETPARPPRKPVRNKPRPGSPAARRDERSEVRSPRPLTGNKGPRPARKPGSPSSAGPGHRKGAPADSGRVIRRDGPAKPNRPPSLQKLKRHKRPRPERRS
jgi:23S rRNA pseudouridine2605 synthase